MPKTKPKPMLRKREATAGHQIDVVFDFDEHFTSPDLQRGNTSTSYDSHKKPHEFSMSTLGRKSFKKHTPPRPRPETSTLDLTQDSDPDDGPPPYQDASVMSQGVRKKLSEFVDSVHNPRVTRNRRCDPDVQAVLDHPIPRTALSNADLTPSMASSLPKVPPLTPIKKQRSHSEQHSITTIFRQPLRKESGSDEDVMVIEHDSSEATRTPRGHGNPRQHSGAVPYHDHIRSRDGRGGGIYGAVFNDQSLGLAREVEVAGSKYTRMSQRSKFDHQTGAHHKPGDSNPSAGGSQDYSPVEAVCYGSRGTLGEGAGRVTVEGAGRVTVKGTIETSDQSCEYVRTSSAYFETNRLQKSSRLPQGDEDGGTQDFFCSPAALKEFKNKTRDFVESSRNNFVRAGTQERFLEQDKDSMQSIRHIQEKSVQRDITSQKTAKRGQIRVAEAQSDSDIHHQQKAAKRPTPDLIHVSENPDSDFLDIHSPPTPDPNVTNRAQISPLPDSTSHHNVFKVTSPNKKRVVFTRDRGEGSKREGQGREERSEVREPRQSKDRPSQQDDVIFQGEEGNKKYPLRDRNTHRRRELDNSPRRGGSRGNTPLLQPRGGGSRGNTPLLPPRGGGRLVNELFENKPASSYSRTRPRSSNSSDLSSNAHSFYGSSAEGYAHTVGNLAIKKPLSCNELLEEATVKSNLKSLRLKSLKGQKRYTTGGASNTQKKSCVVLQPRSNRHLPEPESIALDVTAIQIGRLQDINALNVTLEGDTLALNMDVHDKTHKHNLELKNIAEWKMNLSADPILISLLLRPGEAKKLSNIMTPKFHLDRSFYNPGSKVRKNLQAMKSWDKSEDEAKGTYISEKYIILHFSETPPPNIIADLHDILKNHFVPHPDQLPNTLDAEMSPSDASEFLKSVMPSKPAQVTTDPEYCPSAPSVDYSQVTVRRSSRRTTRSGSGLGSSSNWGSEDCGVVRRRRRRTLADPGKKLLTYKPPGSKLSLEIRELDMECLEIGEYLNDKIMDFYLMYLWHQKLGSHQDSVHIFSSFFHSRLTDSSRDNKTLSTPERIHDRVRTWTRHVDLFNKDYVVLPVCDRSHWFVAFICHPGQYDPNTDTLPRSRGSGKTSSGKTSSRKGRATPKRRRRRPLKTKTPNGAIVLSEDSQEHSERETTHGDEEQSPEDPCLVTAHRDHGTEWMEDTQAAACSSADPNGCPLVPGASLQRAAESDSELQATVHRDDVEEIMSSDEVTSSSQITASLQNTGLEDSLADQDKRWDSVLDDDDDDVAMEDLQEGEGESADGGFSLQLDGASSEEDTARQTPVRVETHSEETAQSSRQTPVRVETHSEETAQSSRQTPVKIETHSEETAQSSRQTPVRVETHSEETAQSSRQTPVRVETHSEETAQSSRQTPVRVETHSEETAQSSRQTPMKIETDSEESQTEIQQEVVSIEGEGEECQEQLVKQEKDSDAPDTTTFHPCIIVLDSLGVKRSAIVKRIRNYLDMEWKAKRHDLPPKKFEGLRVVYPGVLLQDNSSDCGVFVLQYVESLLMTIVEERPLPESPPDWASYQQTNNKRKAIEDLIKKLAQEQQ